MARDYLNVVGFLEDVISVQVFLGFLTGVGIGNLVESGILFIWYDSGDSGVLSIHRIACAPINMRV